MRWRSPPLVAVAAAVACLAMGCGGCGAGAPRSDVGEAAGDGPVSERPRPDLVHVAIAGLAAPDAAAVRDVLADLGADAGDVASLRLAREPAGLQLTAALSPDAARTARAGWAQRAAFGEILRLLAARGVVVESVGGAGRYDTPREGWADIATTAATIERRAGALGWHVSSLVVLPLAGHPLALTVELPESALLGRADPDLVLFPERPGDLARHGSCVVVDAPGGAPLFASCPGASFPEPAGAPAPDPPARVGPTRLVVDLGVPDRASLREVRRVLDCDGGGSTWHGSVAAACARLVRERWSLLGPLHESWTCAGDLAPTVHVTGTFRGQPVDRDYDGCYDQPARWARLAGIPLS